MTVKSPTIFATTTVVVRKPVETVWRLFNDRSRWMDSFKSLEVVEGAIGETGAVARVAMTADGPGVQRLEETLHAERFRRQVIRLTTGGPVAHADFQFEPTPEGCRVTVSIHGFMPQGLDYDVDMLQEQTQAKISHDFENLRVVAETDSQ